MTIARAHDHRLTHLTHIAIAVSLGVCAVLSSYVLLLDHISHILRGLLTLSGVALLLSFSANACANLTEKRGWKFGVVGVALCALAMIASVIAVWDVFTSPVAFAAAAILVNLSVACAHLSMMVPVRLEQAHHSFAVRIIASATIISTVLCTLLITGLLTNVAILPLNGYLQLILILLIMTMAGTVAVPVLIRMQKHSSAGQR